MAMENQDTALTQQRLQDSSSNRGQSASARLTWTQRSVSSWQLPRP